MDDLQSVQYLEGWRAYYKSLDMSDCPHKEESSDYDQWLDGWINADDNERSQQEEE